MIAKPTKLGTKRGLKFERSSCEFFNCILATIQASTAKLSRIVYFRWKRKLPATFEFSIDYITDYTCKFSQKYNTIKQEENDDTLT